LFFFFFFVNLTVTLLTVLNSICHLTAKDIKIKNVQQSARAYISALSLSSFFFFPSFFSCSTMLVDLERRLGEPQVWSDGPESREQRLSLLILD